MSPPSRRRSVVPPEAQSRQDRRSDILKSAEKLFAERGFNGVSIRDIADDAGVPLALVGYYFGKKAELFATIFEHRRDYFDKRVALIGSVEFADGDGDLVEQVVRAWAEPALLAGLEEDGEAFATLVARGLWDAGIENRRAIERHFDQVAHAFLAAMTKALPHCDPGRLVWGYQYAVGSLLTHMVSSRVIDLSGGQESPGDVQRGEELIRFLANGFRALADMNAAER
ncbi:TetR/AcrR family transcriptional regulator [Sphingobium sp. HWE2-09]|uniref:TetR/AcrR family transcriptional regulator n=1 Tax=Sphingobium sp. HWE2-09 TaxID=3108390 RepID=UPI002DC56766|nr:TetR family transcriptional regulator [Sphingobium sp. HWE2-09]